MNNAIRSIAGQVAYVVVSLIIAAVFFLLFEGISSFAIVTKRVFEPSKPLAERRHTQYDPQLGWVNVPNSYIRDMYGPGVYLHTNARGFRGDAEVATAIPPGKIRVICSGDSFTLGYGVSNDRTWCQNLGALDNRLETVNMGQGGYGLDQAYLWYARDGVVLDHDVQIFAFIAADLRRMDLPTFHGYPKPTLSVQGDRLVAHNVPVPQLGAWDRFKQRLMGFRDLQSVTLLQRILYRSSQSAARGNSATLRVAEGIFEQLEEMNRKKDSVLVVLFLPTEDQYEHGMPKDVVELKAAAIRNGITWIDLVDDFRGLSPGEEDRLFFGENGHHYTNEGNAFVARRLRRYITALPAVASKLEHVTKH